MALVQEQPEIMATGIGKKIRILFIHHFSGMGGATMSLFYIVEKLDPQIFDIEILFLGGNGDGVRYFKANGFVVHLLDGIEIFPHAYGAYMSYVSSRPLQPFRRLLSLDKSVERMNDFFHDHGHYDIVHLNTSLLLAAGKAAKLQGSKVVWHVRESLHKGLVGFRRNFVRKWICRYADVILTISSIEKYNLGNPEKAQVVHNYVDLRKFDQTLSGDEARQEWGLLDNHFVVCNLGGGVHSKGTDVFIKAAALLSPKYPDIKFVLAGVFRDIQKGGSTVKSRLKKLLHVKNDLTEEVMRLIAVNSLKDSVKIVGVSTDVPRILAGSDLLAWTATVKHFARPIIEAGAMAKPVVAADFPNTYEAMEDNVSGLVFCPGNYRDLALKIEMVYLDRLKAKQMGEAGFQFVQRKFNAIHNFEKILNVYVSLTTDAR